MRTPISIAILNVMSQLGAGLTVNGGSWEARVVPLKSQLEAAGVNVTEVITINEPHLTSISDPKQKYLDSVASTCRKVYRVCHQCLTNGIIPITIGGDHSVAIGSVSATSDFLRKETEKPLGLIWADAHVDMNTAETTPSGNIHGMALAVLCGLGDPSLTEIGQVTPTVNSRDVVCLGLRFADKSELPHLEGLGVTAYTMRDFDLHGSRAIIDDCFKKRLMKTGGLHLSLDLDVLDPSIAPAVNTPFPGGMTFRELRSVCDAAAESGMLLSLDVVEHNPGKADDDLMLPMIAELIACAVGSSAMPR